VEGYTKATELNPTNAVYFGNRAFAHIKLEEYGSAVEDATVAIELDPAYVKGYYRRGDSYLALGKFKLALKDLKTVGGLCRWRAADAAGGAWPAGPPARRACSAEGDGVLLPPVADDAAAASRDPHPLARATLILSSTCLVLREPAPAHPPPPTP
jgi:hypothetical protein